MHEFLIYNLKVGVCIAAFYLVFKLFMSHDTLHRLNRIVLLAVTIISFILPFCIITIYKTIPAHSEVITTVATTTAIVEIDKGIEWDKIAAIVLFTGVGISLLWTLRSLFAVVRIIRHGKGTRLEDSAILIRQQEPITPFSWIRYIVISESDYAESGSEILSHERAHIRLKHSYDLLLTDIIGCMQWFNPAMWLLRRELRAIHEYEADEAVLNTGIDAKKYQLLLIKKAAGGRWYSIANSFNHSKLKNRITMMLRKKSSKWSAAKVLVLAPMLCLALGAFAQTAYVVQNDKSSKKPEQSQNLTETIVDLKVKPTSNATVIINRIPESATTNSDNKFTNTTSETTSKTVETKPETTGKTAEVRGVSSSVTTDAHGNTTITIRNAPDITNAPEPEIYIDGKRMSGAQLKDLNSKHIKSLTVVKDSVVNSNGEVHITTEKATNVTVFHATPNTKADDVVVVGFGDTKGFTINSNEDLKDATITVDGKKISFRDLKNIDNQTIENVNINKSGDKKTVAISTKKRGGSVAIQITGTDDNNKIFEDAIITIDGKQISGKELKEFKKTAASKIKSISIDKQAEKPTITITTKDKK